MRHLSQLRLHPRTVLVDVRFVMFCCYALFTVIYIAARWLALCRCCWIVSVLCMLLCIKRCGVNVRFFLGRIAVASDIITVTAPHKKKKKKESWCTQQRPYSCPCFYFLLHKTVAWTYNNRTSLWAVIGLHHHQIATRAQFEIYGPFAGKRLAIVRRGTMTLHE